MAASHMWQTRAKSTIVLQMYKLYILLMWTREWLQTMVYACYLWSLSTVCDGRVCDVYFYDLHRHKRTTVLCNSNVIKILYLMLLKYVLNQDISYYLDVQYEYEHWLSKPNGLYEVVFYQGGRWSKALRRTYYRGYDYSAHTTQSGKFLLAMLNGNITITNIVNEYWTSMTKVNAFTTDELASFCLMKMGLPSLNSSGGTPRIFLIRDDDSLDEKIYEDTQVIVLKDA